MFTYQHYVNTCKKYKENGYSFCTPKNPINDKDIIMFHDVDFRIECAEAMSNMENKNDICATYFFRLGSTLYNTLSKSSIIKIKNMINNNSEIGLHYEKIFDNLSYEQEIKKQLEILSTALDYDIKYFNIHEPARTKIDISKLLPEMNRCYNSQYFEHAKYISDSGGRWREGCFSKHIGKHDKMLVLTHPVWWYCTTPNENY